jgi:hypothetical protein
MENFSTKKTNSLESNQVEIIDMNNRPDLIQIFESVNFNPGNYKKIVDKMI